MSRHVNSDAPICEAVNCSGSATRVINRSGSGMESATSARGSHQRRSCRHPTYQRSRPAAAVTSDRRMVNSSAASSLRKRTPTAPANSTPPAHGAGRHWRSTPARQASQQATGKSSSPCPASGSCHQSAANAAAGRANSHAKVTASAASSGSGRGRARGTVRARAGMRDGWGRSPGMPERLRGGGRRHGPRPTGHFRMLSLRARGSLSVSAST